MLWDLEYGGHVKFFKSLRNRGKQSPLDFYINPNVFIKWLLEAFNFLSPSRDMGFDIGYIPIGEMISYSVAFPLLLTENEFCLVIRSMDMEYVRFLNDSKPDKGKDEESE